MLNFKTTDIVCKHCGDPVPLSPFHKNTREEFCCSGCEVIFNCLSQNNLEDFYLFAKDESYKIKKAEDKKSYSYLKDYDFQQQFANGKNKSIFFFHISNIDCMACTWLFDNIASISESILRSSFHLENNVLEVEMVNTSELYRVGRFIQQMGYKFIPLKNVDEAQAISQKERRAEIIRIGVTAALLMNVMIYSIAIYAGVEGKLLKVFNHLLAAFYLPISLYSAYPFYRSLWGSIKVKKVNIDLALTLSIVFGSLLSYYHYFTGSTVFYFDSLGMFIFLILSVRYLLFYSYRRELNQEVFAQTFSEQQVHKLNGETIEDKHISQIKIHDRIRIKKGEIVPLDSSIEAGQSYFNESLITGESNPVVKSIGNQLYSGSLNLSHDISAIVEGDFQQNSFLSFINSMKLSSQSSIGHSQFSQKYIIALFTTIVLISLSALVLWPFEKSGQVVLSLLIICCPCALGIGIPLATLLKVKQCARKGILIHGNDVFDKLHQVKHLCFDKTGTLTRGDFRLTSIEGDQDQIPVLVALEKNGLHPIARFLYRYFQHLEIPLEVKNFKESAGKGVAGDINENHYMIQRDTAGNTVLLKDGTVVLTIGLMEKIDSSLLTKISNWSEQYNIHILSGDKRENVEKLVKEIQLPNIHWKYELSPKEKEKYIQSLNHELYVGDGINDVLAMKQANLAVSLNATPLVNECCDITFLGGRVEKLETLLDEIQHLKSAILSNISISVFYNLIGIWLVLSQKISPLGAAILMPLSSLFVTINCYWRLKEKNKNDQSFKLTQEMAWKR